MTAARDPRDIIADALWRLDGIHVTPDGPDEYHYSNADALVAKLRSAGWLKPDVDRDLMTDLELVALPPAAVLLAEAESLVAEVPEPVVGGLANPVSEARAQLAVLRAQLAVAAALLSAADVAERAT